MQQSVPERDNGRPCCCGMRRRCGRHGHTSLFAYIRHAGAVKMSYERAIYVCECGGGRGWAAKPGRAHRRLLSGRLVIPVYAYYFNLGMHVGSIGISMHIIYQII